MIRKGGTPITRKVNSFKPPASWWGPFVSSSECLAGTTMLAVGEMARYSHVVPFHRTLKYSRLKPLVLSFPLHLLSAPSQKFLSISLFSAFLACFFLWHSFLSLVSFLLHQESKADHTLSFPLSCILSMVHHKALCHEYPLFRERGRSNIPPAHMPLHSWVILKFCPPCVSFQASATSTIPFQTQKCCLFSPGCPRKPTWKGVHLSWQKTCYSYWADVCVFCWVFDR